MTKIWEGANGEEILGQAPANKRERNLQGRIERMKERAHACTSGSAQCGAHRPVWSLPDPADSHFRVPGPGEGTSARLVKYS